MKRALAERAKQSIPQGGETTNAPPPPTTGTTTNSGSSPSASPEQPPKKLPRLEVPTSSPPSLKAVRSASIAGGGASAQQQLQQQQQRNSRIQSLTSAVASEEQDNASAFYLKHQNRALATELQSLQFAVNELEQERDYRRQQCLAACQALNSLQATWTQLETALGDRAATVSTTKTSPSSMMTAATTSLSSSSSEAAPASTGSNKAVEWTRALAEALASLGRSALTAPPPNQPDWEAFYTDLTQLSANVTSRANTLQERIWDLLTNDTAAATAIATAASNSNNSVVTNAEWAAKLASAQAQCRELETQISELSTVRDEVATRERKLRRNLYRLASGMLTTEQVIKGMDSSEDQEIAAQIKLEAATAQQQRHQQEQQPEITATTIKQESKEAGGKGAPTVNSKDVERYEAKIADLERRFTNREKTIENLNDTVKSKELQINELIVKQKSEEDVEKLKSFEAARLKLQSKEKAVEELENKLKETTEKWSQALGNEQALQEALDEQVSKFGKRWSEFTDLIDEDIKSTAPHHAAACISEVPSLAEQVSQAKRITKLRHQLDQAIENVRQAESTRANLAHALDMNQQIQSELESVKTKYTALQEAIRKETAESTNNSVREKESSAAASSASEKSVNESSSKYEKMHRDFRRTRKELAAATASKEAAKAKLERSEKERESLMDTNAKLLRQSTEKDEMNAKSLATILHLKSLTEQLTLERDNLEQQAKSAEQLALAARLATNAKERISEEAMKERQDLEKRLKELEKELAETKSQLTKVTHEWSEGSGKMSTMSTQLSNALKRSEELVTENQAKADEIRRLIDSVDRAEREAQQAKEKLDSVIKGSGGGDVQSGVSAFTVDQLNTQISVLKGRLACPVCHYRDKECIIMRCRHMHCKQCVEERISNRSRKCPTCNNKFSEKDVEDIWLS